jgi:hypothetical protein
VPSAQRFDHFPLIATAYGRRYIGILSSEMWPAPLGTSFGELQRLNAVDLETALERIESEAKPTLLAVETGYSESLTVDGANLHKTVQDQAWWLDQVRRRFEEAELLPSFDSSVAFLVTWRLSPKTRRKIERASKALALRFRMRRSVGGRWNAIRQSLRPTLSIEALLALLQGKRVAVIGNARSLTAGQFGPEIDKADIVIRFNSAPVVHVASHGSRTDWIATGIDITETLVRQRGASVLLWMFKRRRLPGWMHQFPKLCFYPMERMAALTEALGSRPTSGLMVIDLLSESQCNSVELYGFDFFASMSTSGERTKAEVPHDFHGEEAFVLALIARDSRFRLNR